MNQLEKAIAEANRYPDAAREELAEALAAKLGVKADNIVLGNGSTEILQIIVQASNAPKGTLVMADPTFEAISWYQRTLTYATEGDARATWLTEYPLKRPRTWRRWPRRPGRLEALLKGLPGATEGSAARAASPRNPGS